MEDREFSLDMHRRTHLSVARLIAYCRELDAGDLDRELDGFGYPTIRGQIQHAIGGEQYWIGVLRGRIDVEERDEDVATPAAMEEFRARIAASTERLLAEEVSAGELARPRVCSLYGGSTRELVPGAILTRVLTHYYTHIGQVLAMTRLLGKPARYLDYPIDPRS